MRMRSIDQRGIELDVFSKFCPIGGLWAHRIFAFALNGSQTKLLSYPKFLKLIRNLNVAENADSEAISFIYSLFNIDGSGQLRLSEVKTMLMHFPDISSSVRVHSSSKK